MKKIWFLMHFIGILFCFVSMSSAGSYTIRQISGFDGSYFPQINANGDVVWHGFAGTDFDIFLYDGATQITTQLTDNPYHDSYPQINAKGDVVWHGYALNQLNDSALEIFLYDGTTQITTQLTDNLYHDSYPQINANGDIVWFESGRISLATYDSGSSIPEPTTILLFGAGLLGIAGISRKRNNSAPHIA